MVAKAAVYAAALVAVAQSAVAHTIVTSVWVNGEDTADGSNGMASSYMRAPSSNSPVTDLSSASLACNDKGTTKVSGYLTVAPGDTIEPQWWHAGAIGSDPIADSHKGPITTWISPLSANTEGAVWVEIASEAYYQADKQWAVDKLLANAGRNTVKIPSTLAPGDYLVRFDLLALHSASSAGGAQFYPNCAQVTVTGSGSQKLPAGVEIPGFFTEDTPGIVWDIYYSSTYDVTGDYVAPGTGVWDGSATYSTDTCHTVVDGLAPPGYCQGGNNSSAPTTSKGGASSTVAASTSKVASSAVPSSAVVSTTSRAAYESSATVSSSAAASASPTSISSLPPFPFGIRLSAPSSTTSKPVASSAAASPSTSAAPSAPSTPGDSTYTDYNSCMRAYNKCLDSHQPKNGGAADFSACSSFNCSSLQTRRRMKRSARPAQLHGKDRVVRRAH
ncbi:hypothetical protein JCM10213_007231 [Rhodosporidiobolus nylandii]